MPKINTNTWDWECPDCKFWNKLLEDPKNKEKVLCKNCRGFFKPLMAWSGTLIVN